MGILTYTNGYYIELWGSVDLSGTAFFIIAGLFVVFAVFRLIRAPKQDQEEESSFQAEVASIQQQQNPIESESQNENQLTAPCTVIVTHTKGVLGWINKFAVILNGNSVGELKNKSSLNISTTVAKNTITIIKSDNHSTASFSFAVEPNGIVKLNIIIYMLGNVRIEQA